MILVIGDVHIPNEKNLYSKALTLFYDYINQNFKDDILIFVGDIIDNPSKPNYDLIKEFVDFIKTKKQVHIITGNHDILYKGNILKIFENDHIFVYDIPTQQTINNINFYFYPYNVKYFNDYKKQIHKNIDYTIGHYAFKDLNFGNIDEINLPYEPNTKEIIGHIHNYFEYNKKLCIGSIFANRLGEEITDKYLVRIYSKNHYEKIQIPKFYEIKISESLKNFEKPKYYGKIYFMVDFIPSNFKIESDNFEYTFKIKSQKPKAKNIDLDINIDDFDVSKKAIFDLFVKYLDTKNNIKYDKKLLEEILL